MKPLRIHINYNAQDGYLYGGRLFLVCNDGTIKAGSLWRIISSNITYGSNEYKLFKLAFDRNNWLLNDQANSFLHLEGIKKQFEKEWNKYADIEYNFIIHEEDLKVLTHLDSMPVFDFRLYGMRMFIGNRNGLYDGGIKLKTDYEVELIGNRIEKIFDSRTTGITAKSSSIMISSNSDGLFHGTFNSPSERATVNGKAVKPMSLRTGWTGYDIINYESQKDFNYLKNSYELAEERGFIYAKDDENSKKIKITKIAEETIDMEDLFSNVDLDLKNIIYAFNSADSSFLFLKDGRFIRTSLKRTSRISTDIRLSAALQELPSNKINKKISKPISSSIVPNGCVIEFFDSIALIQYNKKIILEDYGATSIRTFPASIRYKNLICIFDGAGVSIHSVFPYKL